MRITVLGATGGIGRAIVTELAAHATALATTVEWERERRRSAATDGRRRVEAVTA